MARGGWKHLPNSTRPPGSAALAGSAVLSLGQLRGEDELLCVYSLPPLNAFRKLPK